MPCKNAKNPCPGCRKHAASADPRMMFLRPEDFETPDPRRAPRPEPRHEGRSMLAFAS